MSCSGQNHTLLLSCLYAFALFNCQRCPYIAHMFLNFLYIVMFWHFKKPFQLETHCLFRASRFLEIARDSAQSMPLICKLTRGAPHLYLAILPGKQYSSLPWSSQGQKKTTRNHPYSLKLIRIIQIIHNHQPFTLPCLVFPAETSIKAMA